MSAKLKALYRQIPAFACKPGCTDCCGPVPFARDEWKAIQVKRAGKPGCTDCAYIENGACSIYAHRPLMCRLFGATDDPALACPHGCGPERPLTRAQTDLLRTRYRKLVGATPAGWSIDVSHVGALVTKGQA